MKIFGHPVHIMLIHFPSALIPMDFVCYALQYYTHQPSFAFASFYALVGVVATGWAAVLFGILDTAEIPPEKTAAISKALIHGGINVLIIIIYTVLAYNAYKKYPALPEATLTLLAIKGVTVGFLIMGNYLGGSLILKDKIGIEE